MRKAILIAAVLLLAVGATVQAQMPKMGFGVFGGLNIPVAMDDQSSGTVFGVRARVKLIPLITVEPNITFAKWGDPDPVEDLDLGISGSKITGFGLDLTFGGGLASVGFKPFLFAGLGSFKIKNDDTDFDETNIGYKAGVGFAFGVTPKFDLDLRGAALIVPMEDGGSKKGVLAMAGLTYNL